MKIKLYTWKNEQRRLREFRSVEEAAQFAINSKERPSLLCTIRDARYRSDHGDNMITHWSQSEPISLLERLAKGRE